MDKARLIKELNEGNETSLLIETIISIAQTNDFDEDVVKSLCELITHDDSGVRDVAVRALCDLKGNLARLAAEIIAPHILSHNIELRNTAGDILAHLGEPSAEFLLNYLDNPDPDVRKFACDLFGLINTRHLAHRIHPLLDDPDENVVQAAIETLGNYQDEAIIEKLVKIYNTKEDQKPNVIEALGKIGSRKAIDFLIFALTDEKDDFLKTEIIDALSINCDDIEVARQLFSKIEEVSETIQIIILKTVAAISFRLGEEFTLPDNLRYLAYKALFDDDDDIRAAGLISLGNVFVKDDFPSLMNEIFKGNSDTQSFVLEKLLKYNSPEIIKDFFKAFYNEIINRSMIGCDIDFLSLLTYLWDETPDNNKYAVIDVIFDNLIVCKSIECSSAVELLFKLDYQKSIEKIKQLYVISDDNNKEYIEELFNNAGIDISLIHH
ncbi:MAG: HEAT repeat domain-containing protein [Bacteroidota bacterium]